MVSELFSAQAFNTILHDPRFIAAVVVTLISGVVRGFSGFGSALIYIPLIAAIYEPRIAAVTLLVTDFSASAPFSVAQMRHCNWREVSPVTFGALATIPLGVLALEYLDPLVLRWCIAILVIGLLAVLASGWRYQVTPRVSTSLGIGLISGVSTGAVQIAGPAAIIYWLGGPSSAPVIRANLMVYFMLLAIASFVIYFFRGLFTADVLLMSILLFPVFVVSMTAGAWMFKGASEHAYRRAAYIIIALSALVSLPLFDELIR